MIDGFGMQALNEGELVRHLRGVREQLADPGAPTSMLLEFEFRRHDGKARLRGRHPCKPLALAHRFRKILALKFLKSGFVVEQLHLRRAAGLEKVNDALRLRREVWEAGQATMNRGV